MNPPPGPMPTEFLVAQGLMAPGEPAVWTPLTGGVGADLWRVDLLGRSVCVKRDLERLKLTADWHAPLSRNALEFAWMRFAVRHLPGSVPQPLAHDPHAGLFAMEYLPQQRYPVWQAQLMSGEVDIATAAAVGRVLGVLHSAGARDGALAREFATDANFDALRIEPYLLATAHVHPELADVLEGVARRTASTHLAVVHGDVSLKNILVGPAGPVLLGTECAWYGDPAFDLAFCLHQLLLACLAVPASRAKLYAAATALIEAYGEHIGWESVATVDARVAALLPALLLGRLDGKPPVEYLRDPAERDFVRTVAKALLRTSAPSTGAVVGAWHMALRRRYAPPSPARHAPTRVLESPHHAAAGESQA